MFKKILHEPLVHFLVLGALVFVIYAYVSDDTDGDEHKIVIAKAEVKQLTYRWKKKHFRPPNSKEKQELLDKAIYNEIMSREASRIGLDKNDFIIKRRLTQKLEFVSSDLSQLQKPTNDELLKYLNEHKKQFMLPENISFRIKENIMLPLENNELTKYEVSKTFGKVFANELFDLQTDRWIKDVKSAYGPLTVYVKSKTSEKLPTFKSIEKKLYVAWMNEQKEKTDKDFYNNLKKAYTVEIEN